MKSKLLLILTVGCLFGSITAQALPLVFSAPLTGLSEIPSNASPGSGFTTVTVDDVAKTLRVEASFADLIGTTAAAHIHCCAPGNTGVASSVPSFPGFPAGVTSGAYDMVFDMASATSYNPGFILDNGGTPESAFSALLAGLNAGTAYFNLHSSAFPAGELRGNLQAEVSSPGTALLLGLGLFWISLHRLRSRV